MLCAIAFPAQEQVSANMTSRRSLITSWQHEIVCLDFEQTNRKPNGRFWHKQRMNGHSPREPQIPTRSTPPPQSVPANMSQVEEQTKRPPQSAAPEHHGTLLPAPYYDRGFGKFHQHNLSDSTNTIGSNESSPTTTISTVDDSSATEPSPGSSPESPPPATFAAGMLRPRTADSSAPFFELQKQPPPKKGRNLKNLAVNTSRHTARAASTTCLPLEIRPDAGSTILSPSFVKPPSPPRRKPSNLGLTILTPGGVKPPPQEVRLTIPATPAFGRPGTLRHFQSSPSLPVIPGLSLPHINHQQDFRQQKALETIFSPIQQKEPPREAEEEEQNFDIPLSREEKPEAYPDGPICVYDPHIDLYLEPTAEQARKYDVIMNVASEVRNPFVELREPAPSEPSLRLDGGGGIQYAPKRTHLDLNTGSTTHTVQLDASPTTPKATPLTTHFPKDALPIATVENPEYIHIPWEHNSDIVPDLLRLVKLIDEKVTQGKRVLIHCQCGVSRSASLVVAYGLYKDPLMSVQEAYDAVKKRSKWIGPNMNLIMQLQEFRSSLARGGLLPDNRGLSPITPSSALSEWRGPFSADPTVAPTKEVALPPATTSAMDSKPAGHESAVSPGPSSAPSGYPWSAKDKPRDQSPSTIKPAHAYVDPSGHVVPVLNVIETNAGNSKQMPLLRQTASEPTDTSALADTSSDSSRPAEFAMVPLKPPEEVDPADSFGLMSPSTTEFAVNPFDRSALLASLGMGSMRADEDTPRRSLTLGRTRQKSQDPGSLGAPRSMRKKISSPTLREQQQLQSLQAKIEASLPVRSPPSQRGTDTNTNTMDDALMSPRATEFTTNPFSLAMAMPQSHPAVSADNESMRAPEDDPRSPAQKGASPITRNILDVL